MSGMSKLLFLSLRNGEIGPEVARAEYHDALRATGLEDVDMELRIIDTEHAHLGPLDSVRGVIVGGSSLNVTDAEPTAWAKHVDEVLAEVVESGLPVFFVCYGLSWLVNHLGGEIGHSHPEDSGPTAVEVTEVGATDPLLAGGGTFTALTGHTENPVRLPEDSRLALLASGPTCPVQMVRYRDNVWATQFHAEMDADAMRTRMDFYADYGYFPAEEYARIVADLPNHDVSRANRLLRDFTRLCKDA